MTQTQYQVKKRFVNGGIVVEFHDGETLVFATTPISGEFSLLADMIHSTLNVAIGMGFLKNPG